MPLPQISFEPSSSYEDALARAADEKGIYREYWDVLHKRHEISTDVQRRILAALGVDVSSFESVEEKRVRMFQRAAAFALPPTLVISSLESTVPLSLATSLQASIRFEILLEKGGALAGTIEISQLPVRREIVMGDMQWL